MAIDAVKRVRTVVDGRVEVDVKRYARVEKIPGGEMEDCTVSGLVVRGSMLWDNVYMGGKHGGLSTASGLRWLHAFEQHLGAKWRTVR